MQNFYRIRDKNAVLSKAEALLQALLAYSLVLLTWTDSSLEELVVTVSVVYVVPVTTSNPCYDNSNNLTVSSINNRLAAIKKAGRFSVRLFLLLIDNLTYP